jgi:hypothetical protein
MSYDGMSYDDMVDECVRRGLVRRLKLRGSIATTRKGRQVLKSAALVDERVRIQMEHILAGKSLIGDQPIRFSERDDYFADLVVTVYADRIIPFDDDEKPQGRPVDGPLSGYTADEIALACKHRWIKRRRFGRGYTVTDKGYFHTTEWINKDDEFRAYVSGLDEKAAEMSEEEKHAAHVEMTLNAHRRNEASYHESLANLKAMGLDPTETLREMGLDP